MLAGADPVFSATRRGALTLMAGAVAVPTPACEVDDLVIVEVAGASAVKQ